MWSMSEFLEKMFPVEKYKYSYLTVWNGSDYGANGRNSSKRVGLWWKRVEMGRNSSELDGLCRNMLGTGRNMVGTCLTMVGPGRNRLDPVRISWNGSKYSQNASKYGGTWSDRVGYGRNMV